MATNRSKLLALTILILLFALIAAPGTPVLPPRRQLRIAFLFTSDNP